jgi:hypothetical protein
MKEPVPEVSTPNLRLVHSFAIDWFPPGPAIFRETEDSKGNVVQGLIPRIDVSRTAKSTPGLPAQNA